ncbi:hypothetical protein QTP86_013796, partial [Hemibagrus guttatus]
MVQSNEECGKEVKKQVQAGWNGWRMVLGVLCDRKISARIKGKVYRTVERPAMLYGLETVSLRKRQEAELEVAELKMLRFSLGVTRLDRIRNEYIRGTAHVGRLGDKVREARLRWFGHVQRRESEYIGRRMLDMELPGRRQRGRPKRRYMDGINEDMKLVGASVEDAEDRDRWREMIRCEEGAGKMDKSKDLSEFEKGQIVMARQLDQSISKTAALVGCSRSAVVSIYQKWSKEGTVVNQRQGHGRPRLIDARGELRLARVIRSNRRATVAQIAEELNAGSDRKVSEYTVHDGSGLFWQQKGDQNNIRQVVIMLYL